MLAGQKTLNGNVEVLNELESYIFTNNLSKSVLMTDEKIVYVFLSNRSYPNSVENKLLKNNIRTDIQKLIYESIIK